MYIQPCKNPIVRLVSSHIFTFVAESLGAVSRVTILHIKPHALVSSQSMLYSRVGLDVGVWPRSYLRLSMMTLHKHAVDCLSNYVLLTIPLYQ